MTGIRVDRPVDEWEKVPRRMPDDWRLSLDTRAVAVWIATRTETFNISVGGIRTCLGIGKDAWRRIRDELMSAGYLETELEHGQAGRFEAGLVFHLVPVGGFPPRPPTAEPPKNAKKMKKTAAQPATANPPTANPPTAEPPSTRDLSRQDNSLSLRDSHKKEIEDREFAVRLGKKNGLSDAEIEAILCQCRYPSEMPRAMQNATRRGAGSKDSHEKRSAAAQRARALVGRLFSRRDGKTVAFQAGGVLVDGDYLLPFESEKILNVFKDIDEGRLREQ